MTERAPITPTAFTPAYTCGYAESHIATALRYLRDIPAHDDEIAAMRMRWAIDALEDVQRALAAPFDVACGGGAS